jgi:hypothetical protein
MKSDPKFNGRYVSVLEAPWLFVDEIEIVPGLPILWLHAYCQCRLSWDKQFEMTWQGSFTL